MCVHGLFGSLENLGTITRVLKTDYCVYAVDLPNHGRSPHTAHTSLEAMTAALVEWLDTMGLERAHFLGHSLGGKVVMELALRYPQRVGKLVVADIAPVAYPRRHDQIFAGFHAVDLSTITTRADADGAMAAYVSEPAVRSFLLKNLEKNTDGWQWRINLPVLEADYEQLIAGNSTDLPAFTGDVLFIKGEQSNYILPEHRQPTLQLFPNAQVKIIHNTEHWLHAEKPDIFAGMVQRFLQ